MKCQLKYRWVKLPRACLPQGKGVLGQWARLAARAAYRKGVGLYCGFKNPVEPGMWAGGVVGLKSILGTRSRKAALEALEQLRRWATSATPWTAPRKSWSTPCWTGYAPVQGKPAWGRASTP